MCIFSSNIAKQNRRLYEWTTVFHKANKFELDNTNICWYNLQFLYLSDPVIKDWCEQIKFKEYHHENGSINLLPHKMANRLTHQMA